MKLHKLLLGLSLVALVGCAPSNNEDNKVPDPDVPTPPIVIEEEYNVKLVSSVSAIELTSDKAKAKEGEIVTITVNVKDPTYKVTKVFADSVECNKLGENKYSFVMPNHPVKVTYSAFVDGDVTLQGELSASFEKEGDIYAARDVVVTQRSRFDVVVKDKTGQSKKLGIRSFDRFKSFANISFASGTYGLEIAGGSTYDFFYNPSNIVTPLSVVRTNVDLLPNSVDSLETLFGGSIGSNSSVNPLNLTGVKYSNKLANETLDWKSYNNNTAFGKVTEIDSTGKVQDKAIMYAEIKDNTLTNVDTRTPGAEKTHKKNYEFKKDTDLYSGLYKISEVDGDGLATETNEFKYRKNFQSSAVANSLLTVAPVTMRAFEADVMYAYRVGLDIDEDVTQANKSIVSQPTSQGFQTKIVSSKTSAIQENNGQSNLKEHFEYRVTLDFDKSGKLLKGFYEEKSFNESLYDFANESWKIGDASSNYDKGTLINKITIEYTYGEKEASNITFDKTPYFVSELKNVKVNNPQTAGGENDNMINVGESANDYLTFDYAPKTALNVNQFKVIASENDKFIDSKDSFRGVNEGNTNLTVGIENGLGPNVKVNVKVAYSFLIRNIILDPTSSKYAPTLTTDSANVYSGAKVTFGLLIYKTQGNTYINVPLPKDAKVSFIGESYGLNASFNYENKELIIDATKATQTNVDVKVKIDTKLYDPSWVSAPKEFTFHILPGATIDTLKGKWTSHEDTYNGDTISFTTNKWDTTTPGYNETRPYQGSITSGDKSFQFAYQYYPAKNTIEAEVVGLNGISSYLLIEYDIARNEIGVALKVYSIEGETTKSENILGYQEGDDLVFTHFQRN